MRGDGVVVARQILSGRQAIQFLTQLHPRWKLRGIVGDIYRTARRRPLVAARVAGEGR
jgi:hypothetical protein